MTTIGAILLGVVFCSPLVVVIWAAAAMAGKADEDMGIKVEGAAMSCLLPHEAHAVWDLLVELAGADPLGRHNCVGYLTSYARFGHEYRFGGVLGSGGTLYRNTRGTYVACYPEHRTGARDAIVAAVNARLDEMLSGVPR